MNYLKKKMCKVINYIGTTYTNYIAYDFMVMCYYFIYDILSVNNNYVLYCSVFNGLKTKTSYYIVSISIVLY